MPVLFASSAGPVYGTADSPGPWTREEGGKAGSAPLVLMEPEAYEQLQLGTVALLEGKPSVALAHFVQAHVFGFLPCLLVSASLASFSYAGLSRSRLSCPNRFLALPLLRKVIPICL